MQLYKEENMKTKKLLSVNATLLLMALSFGVIAITVDGFTAMLPLVSEEFNLTSAQAGLYATAFFLTGLVLVLVAGPIVDRIGSRNGLIGALLLVMIFVFLYTIVPSFTIILGLAIFTGTAFTLVTPSLTKGVIEIVDPSKRAISNGLVQAGAAAGGIVASFVVPLIGENLGWRYGVYLGVVLAAVMLLLVTRYFFPSELGDPKPKSTTKYRENLGKIVRNPLIWIVASMGIVVGLSVGTITIHYTLYLSRDLAYSASAAGFYLALFNAGGVIGNPLFGYINDKYLNSNRRTGLFGLSLSIAALYVFMAFVVGSGALGGLLLGIFSFIFGAFAFASIGLLFTAIGDVAGPVLMGTGTTILLIFSRSTLVIGPAILGQIADETGSYQQSWLISAAVIAVVATLFYVLSAKYKSQLQR
jgi:predicted MFS family arabinose efflux permease